MSLPRALAPNALFPPHCAARRAPGAILCTACASRQEVPLALPAVCSAALYEGAIRQAAGAGEFWGQRRVGEPLGERQGAEVHRAGWRSDVIAPVPLHRTRLCQRGYHQAKLVARARGRRLGVPGQQDGLVLRRRRRAASQQVDTPATARRAHVGGACATAPPPSGAHPLAGQRVLSIEVVAATVGWDLAITRPDLRAAGQQRPPARVAATLQREAGEGYDP